MAFHQTCIAPNLPTPLYRAPTSTTPAILARRRSLARRADPVFPVRRVPPGGPMHSTTCSHQLPAPNLRGPVLLHIPHGPNQLVHTQRATVKPVLPQVSRRSSPRLEIVRVAVVRPPKRLRQRVFPVRRHNPMHMVRHQRIAEDRNITVGGVLLDQVQIDFPILITVKDDSRWLPLCVTWWAQSSHDNPLVSRHTNVVCRNSWDLLKKRGNC